MPDVSLTRYAHVCTSHGVGLPALRKAAAAEILANEHEARLAKGRAKPVSTNVGRYVAKKAPAVARDLAKVLQAHGERFASQVKQRYAELVVREQLRSASKLLKDATTIGIIDQLIAELDSDDMGEDLQGELLGPMQAAFKRAAAVGATQAGIDFDGITDQVDDAAVAYAAKRGGDLITDLAGTTDDQVRALLSRAVSEGMSVDELSTQIEGLGAFSDYRADLIAQTELARAHVQGNVTGWKASGQVEGKRWLLADNHPEPDECDDAADAGEVGIDDDFIDGIDYPPAHPGCCISGTLVAPGGRITAHFHRWFEGEVVEISAGRQHLTVTPNHPVLTNRGWVAAGDLQLTDHLFECADPFRASALVDPHDHNMPTRIEEIAHALLMAGGCSTTSMPATAEAFHGDGAADGEVDVVWAAGVLAKDAAAGSFKRAVQQRLGFGHPARIGLTRERSVVVLAQADLAPSNRNVCSFRPLFSDLGRRPRVEHDVALSPASNSQAIALEHLAQRGAVTVEALCEIHGGLTGLVEPVEVRQIRKRDFAGHVFNLSTEHGWYFADGLLTHNCLCDVAPVLKDSTDDSDDSEGDDS